MRPSIVHPPTPLAPDKRVHEATYPGTPQQVCHARAALAKLLDGCPLAQESVLVASELCANAVVHSASGAGGQFTVRAEVHGNYVRIEVEDGGGSWDRRQYDDRPHGLDVVQAIAGIGNWGFIGDDAGRVVWAKLEWTP
jgi:hypothetical protein